MSQPKRGKTPRQPTNPKCLPLAVVKVDGVTVGLGFTEKVEGVAYSRVIANPIPADFGCPYIAKDFAEIVKRYNSHDALLAACEAVAANYDDPTVGWSACREQVEAAIRLARTPAR